MEDVTELRELNNEDLELVAGGFSGNINGIDLSTLPPGTSLNFVNNNYTSNEGNQGVFIASVG